MARVVILGFPNAGKSTLFNKLIGRRKALVHSRAGMTRDRVSGTCRTGDAAFELVDTGGFTDQGGEPLAVKVKAAAWEAARTADALVLVLDGQAGLIPAEEELYRDLRKLDRPLLVAVNKVDTEAQRHAMGDYYRLGADRLFFVSAEHKLGIGRLAEAIASVLPSEPAPAGSDAPGEEAGETMTAASGGKAKPLKIALIGRINVGKSSLANRLCGEERFIVSELPGTTRDSSDILLRRGPKSYLLVDTAGIRKLGRVADVRESAGVIKAKKNIPYADVLCLVLDAREFPTRQDAAVAKIAFESGKPLVIVLNKWDLVPEDQVSFALARDIVFSRLEFVGYAPLVTVSALTGKRVTRILDLAEDVYIRGQKMISTGKLNKFVESMNEDFPPISTKGRRFTVKYATQKGILPPTFVLFTSSPAVFSPAYEKSYVQKMRIAFGMEGTPVRLIMRSGKKKKPA
jgi:GTP-binding protein